MTAPHFSPPTSMELVSVYIPAPLFCWSFQHHYSSSHCFSFSSPTTLSTSFSSPYPHRTFVGTKPASYILFLSHSHPQPPYLSRCIVHHSCAANCTDMLGSVIAHEASILWWLYGLENTSKVARCCATFRTALKTFWRCPAVWQYRQ